MEDEDIVEKSLGASDDEEYGDERSHNKMLAAIGALDNKNRARQLLLRTESSAKVSEFHASATKKLHLHEMVSALQRTAGSDALKHQLKTVKKRHAVLAASLSRPEQEKVQRTVAYQTTTDDIAKWDPVVRENRLADQLSFPLNRPDLGLVTTDKFVKRFQPYTDMEKEISKMTKSSSSDLPKGQCLSANEMKALDAMDLQQAKERRAELQKYRVLLSFKEAKATRQKKIKSKKYHQIKRKAKLKDETKKLELMEKTDHEAYLEKLKDIDKMRMTERMSLKHRGGSKYMHRRIIYAKYDEESRQNVQEMLQKSRELTRKRAEQSESDEERDMDDDAPANTDVDPASRSNPWMKEARFAKQSNAVEPGGGGGDAESGGAEEEAQGGGSRRLKEIRNPDCQRDTPERPPVTAAEEKPVEVRKGASADAGKPSVEEDGVGEEQTIDDIFSKTKKRKVEDAEPEKRGKRRKKTAERKRRVRQKEAPQKRKKEEVEEVDSSDEEGGGLVASTTRRKTEEDFEGDISGDEAPTPSDIAATTAAEGVAVAPATQAKRVEVDPNKVFVIETDLRHSRPPGFIVSGDGGGANDAEVDDTEQRRLTIAEAFASDDVIEEFRKEKTATEELDRPKAIDLSLPGWGSWGGTGLKQSKRVRKRFIIEPQPPRPRRDRNLPNVIISETKDNSIAKHQVAQLPFPFKSVHQFESSVRQPIGSTWNPETTFQKLIKPKVVSMLGTIIEPLDKAELFKKGHKAAGKMAAGRGAGRKWKNNRKDAEKKKG